MEPPPFGAGNVTSSVMSTAPSATFNGATAFRRWKPGIVAPNLDVPLVPSMEPPPFGAGNHTRSGATPPSCGSFNGATAFRRWKQDGPLLRRQVLDPSMEPPPFGAGNSGKWKKPLPGGLCLQWSHRLSALETCHQGGIPLPGDGLPSMEPPPFGAGNLSSYA